MQRSLPLAPDTASQRFGNHMLYFRNVLPALRKRVTLIVFEAPISSGPGDWIAYHAVQEGNQTVGRVEGGLSRILNRGANIRWGGRRPAFWWEGMDRAHGYIALLRSRAKAAASRGSPFSTVANARMQSRA